MFFSFIVAIIGIVWTSKIVKALLDKEYARQKLTDSNAASIEQEYQEVDDTAVIFEDQTSVSELKQSQKNSDLELGNSTLPIGF